MDITGGSQQGCSFTNGSVGLLLAARQLDEMEAERAEVFVGA